MYIGAGSNPASHYIMKGKREMVEICYKHEHIGDILYQQKLSIGHGLPHHGQMDFITLISEEIEMGTGQTLWARMRWGWSMHRLRQWINKRLHR